MDDDDAPRARVQENRVVVTNVDIQFGTMVWLMVKASFAAAIAALITSFLWALVGVLLVGLMGLGLWLMGMAFLALGFGSAMMMGAPEPPPPSPPEPTEIVEPPPDLTPPPLLPGRPPAAPKTATRNAGPAQSLDLQAQQNLALAAAEACQLWGAASDECAKANGEFNAYQRRFGEAQIDYAAHAQARSDATRNDPTNLAIAAARQHEAEQDAARAAAPDPALVQQRARLAYAVTAACAAPVGLLGPCKKAREEATAFDAKHPGLATN